MEDRLEGALIAGISLAAGFSAGYLVSRHCQPVPTPQPPSTDIHKSFVSEVTVFQGVRFNHISGVQFNHLLKIKGKIMAVEIKDSQKVTGTLSFVDAKGAPTDVADGSVTVSSSDEAIATVSYDDPSNKLTVVAGNPGVAAITIKATSQSGADLPFDDVAVEVKSGDAVSGSVVFDSPTEQ